MSVFIYTNSAKTLRKKISSIGPNLKIIGICYYMIVLKEEKKKQIHYSHNFFIKTHIVQQTKHQLRHNISKHIDFLNIRNCTGPLDVENKFVLTKRTTKTEENEKLSKKYNIKNFMTIRYKLIASSNTTLSMCIYKLMRYVSIVSSERPLKN